MNSQDKRHGGHRQGPGKHGDGFADASGFMDETDREVSSLTDRAFRSLCIGEEAVYNDSSPAGRYKAFGDEALGDAGSPRGRVLRGAAEPYGSAAGAPGMAPTFRLSATDEALAAKHEHGLAGDCVSHHSNGVIEATWQQKRSSSGVSSLIRAYRGSGGSNADAAVMSQDSVYTQGKDSWDGSALMSIQKELSEFSSVYHQSIKGSSYSQTRNHFQSSEVAAAPQVPSNAESSAPSPAFSKSSTKCSGSSKMPSSRNFFLHSEFSPFQTWKEYNRLLYDREALPQVLSADQSPRWYDSPFYKELTVAHRAQMAQLEEQRSHRKQHDGGVLAEPPASTVHQKAPAIEKRRSSESEIMVNCPPWKRSQEPVKNKFSQNRPCTASPLSDKSRRKEDILVSTGRISATNHKVQTVADEQPSNSGTPFSISQLLTPTIHPRQETETSEILQYALSPNILSPPLSSETDPRQTPEIKPRNKYKAMASSLLFNLKDNRKRVKSTYTPTMFKSTEIADHSKQPSQLDSLTGRDGAVASDTPLSWTGAPVRSDRMELLSVSSPVAQSTRTHTVSYVRRTDGCQSDDYLTLISPKTVREASSYRSFSHTPQETVSFRDKLADAQSGRHVDSLFTASKSNETPVGRRPDPSSWKAYEMKSSQGQDKDPKAPEMQGLSQSFNRKEHDKEMKDFTKRDVPTLRADEHVENTKARGQYDHKLEAEANLIKNDTNKKNGVFRTERVPVMGDIAALLEKDKQILEAQRENTNKLGTMVSGEKHSIKKELFASIEKGNATQELLATKEKQFAPNELLRKNEIHPSWQVDVKRQNSYATNEGLNPRQEYRHINQGMYDAQENYHDNLAANKGLYPTRGIKYTSTDTFGRKEQGNQAVPVTRENRPAKNEFAVKEQDSLYLQGQVTQRVPSRTDNRHISNYSSVINQHEKTVQELRQYVAKDDKHPNNVAFAITDHNPTKHVQAAGENNTIFVSETSSQVKHVPPSASGVRYAPIEEFARKDRELEKQRLTAMGETKHEPVKVQALIKQYEGSIGENRNGAKMGLFTTGEFKEVKSGGVQEKYMSDTVSVPVHEQGKVLHVPLYSTAPSDTAKDHRGFNTALPAASEYERTAKDVLASRQKPVQNEVCLSKEHEAVPSREKGQTRQEILTSKLKAHAEKEIFAIKEKGHAKWDAHATKQKELYTHGNKDGEPLSTDAKKNMVPVGGNRLAKQDSSPGLEARCRVVINQEAPPSVEHVKITTDGENRPAKPASTTREKEHSRNYIIAKTEKISIRQEELQSIARAKIEAIAVNRIQQPKRANEESTTVHLSSPLNLRGNAENIAAEAIMNVSQVESDARNDFVHAVKERERVKTEGLPDEQEPQNLGTAVSGIHKAENVLLNKEISDDSQGVFMSSEHSRNETKNHQVAGEMFLRREREGHTSDVPVNKEEASAEHPIAEHIENKITANHEKYKDAVPVTIEKEHASNYAFVSKEQVTVKQEVPPSIEHVVRKNAVANSEPCLVREGIGVVEKDHDKNEIAAPHENHQVKLDSLASRKSESAGNNALGIQIRSVWEDLSPVTNVKMEAIMDNQREESTHERTNKNMDIVLQELPWSLEKENGDSNTITMSENPLAKPVAVVTKETDDDKNEEKDAKDERISLKQEVPQLVQHRNKTFAVQENDAYKQVEKEHTKTGAQNKERDLFRQEEPSVEHIRIRIISHDEIPQVSESIFAVGNAKRETGALQESQQVTLDSVASRKSEQDPHRNTVGLAVKQEEHPPIVHVESEVVANSESLSANQEPENRDKDAKLEISHSVEEEDIKKEINAVNDNYLANPTIAMREVECAKNDQLTKKQEIAVVEDEPPSVEHIRIKIITHDVNRPDREKIVSIDKENISLHENRLFIIDSHACGKNQSPENDAGVPERIRSGQEELPPIQSTEAETIAGNHGHEATHEPANKDRGTGVHELPQSTEEVNGTNDGSCLADPEAAASRETEDEKSDEERIDDGQEVEHATREATAEEEMHGDKRSVSVTGPNERSESCEPVSKDKVSFTQEEPSVKHNRIEVIPVDETHQVRDIIVALEKERSIQETAENLHIKLDSLASKKNENAEMIALGSTERAGDSLEESPSHTTSEGIAVNRNPWLENVLERTERKSVMKLVPTSREEESIINETAEIIEKHVPKLEVLETRETKDVKTDLLAKKETTDLGQDVLISLQSFEKENIQIIESFPVKLEVHNIGGKDHAKSDVKKETDQCDTIAIKEERSDGSEELSSVAHINVEVKAYHNPKHELGSEVRDRVRQELPQPREHEPIQEGSIAVSQKHKGKQEVLPTRKIEFVEYVVEEKENTQKERSFNTNDYVTQGTHAGRREHSGNVHTNKEEAIAGVEGLPSIPLTKTVTIGESHQDKHGLINRDGENATHQMAPAVAREYLQNKTTAVTENHLAREEVDMTRAADAKNEAIMNKERDGVRLQVHPLKKNEQARSVRSVTDKIHQAVLADRNGSNDSESSLKTTRVTDEPVVGSENRRDKQEALPTRERARVQNQSIAFEENLQFKLEALARRRKEKAEKNARANADGTARRGEGASTPRAQTETLVANKNRLAKHGLVIDDTGHITYGISTREKANVRNATASANGKMEAYVVSNKEYGKKDTLVNNDPVSVRPRELSREREHHQNQMLDMGDHQVKHILENKQKGRINQALLPSEHIRNDSISARARKEAFVTSNKQDTRNFGAANKVGDGGSKDETGTGSVNHKGKLGFLETQVEKDSDRHGHTNRGGIKDRDDIVTPREKENDNRQVIEKERQSVSVMKTGAKEGQYTKGEIFPTKMSIIRKGELSTMEKGPTILDYLLEKDRDRSKENVPAVKETDTNKQELHETIDSTKKEALVLQKKELLKNEGFARRGNTTVSNMATKDREGTENKECGGKEMTSVLPDVLVRKVTTESTSAFRDERPVKRVATEAAELKKEELFSRKYQSLSENLKEHTTHEVLVTKDRPKLEAIAIGSSKQEVELTKEREPIRKYMFAVKGKGETAGDGLSTKHTDHTQTKERADRGGRSANRQEMLMEQYQNLSENILLIQDKDLSKSAADVMKDNEHRKQERIVSSVEANRTQLAKKGHLYARPEVFSAHENIHTHPEVDASTDKTKYHSEKEAQSHTHPDVYASTDKAKYHSDKEALSHRQGYYSKHPTTLVSGEKDNLHRRQVVPRGKGKMEVEALPNTPNEIKETLPLREKEREIVAMRERRAKERAAAHQKQQSYEQEALPKQEYATYKTFPMKEKTGIRHEVPAQFEKENAKKEVLANNLNDRTEIAARDQPKQNITGQSIHEPQNQHAAPSRPLQTSGWRGAPIFSQQPGHITVPSRESYLTVGDAPQSPEEEYKARPSSRSTQRQMAKGSEEKCVVEEVRKDMGRPGEALQYYAIINHEQKMETGDRAVASSQSHARTPRKDASGLVHGMVNEGALAQSSTDYTKAQMTTPRSNTSSPSSGKPILFKVKDNSLRGSPVTKTVKQDFHKTLDDPRLGFFQENLSVIEKGDEECNRLKEHVDVPILHNAAAASARVSRSRELPGQHSLPAPDFTTTRAQQTHNIHSAPEYTTVREQSAHNVGPTPEFISVREPRSYYRRNRRLQEDGRNSVISTMSEDLESCATSVPGMSASMYMENSYERPESACSLPLGKPPSVPPKSEKALLRAKKLATRRIKKAESKAESKAKAESPTPVEHKPLRAVASMPSSPTEPLLSRRPAPTQQAMPQYCLEPGYAPQPASLLAQPFPLTQRKLLQDPNSGQYFVVDMPVPVKTKMFFDPETGKYVQLSVRQSPEGTRSNTSSVELLSPPPYVLYPGFLPMPVSSLPPLRSASQMSAPAALMEGQEKRSDPRRLEAFQRKCSREAEPYIEPAYGSQSQPGGKLSCNDEMGYSRQRNSNIIPMSELEDFAMES